MLEIVDVVIDGVQAVPAGLDEEVVERHIERVPRRHRSGGRLALHR